MLAELKTGIRRRGWCDVHVLASSGSEDVAIRVASSVFVLQEESCSSVCSASPPPPLPKLPAANQARLPHLIIVPLSVLHLSPYSQHRQPPKSQYEFYFPALADLSAEGYVVTITAQLGSGATASSWKIDIFEFGRGDTWVYVGDMDGGEPCSTTPAEGRMS